MLGLFQLLAVERERLADHLKLLLAHWDVEQRALYIQLNPIEVGERLEELLGLGQPLVDRQLIHVDEVEDERLEVLVEAAADELRSEPFIVVIYRLEGQLLLHYLDTFTLVEIWLPPLSLDPVRVIKKLLSKLVVQLRLLQALLLHLG